MVSRKRERKRWRTETKLPYNIYVCIRARFLWCAASVFLERCTRFDQNPKYSQSFSFKPASKSSRRQTTIKSTATARECYENDLTKRSAELYTAFIKVVVLYISRFGEEERKTRE